MNRKIAIALISLFIVLNYPACNSEQGSAVTPEQLPTITQILIKPPTAQVSQLFNLDELRERWLGGVPCAPPCWEGIIPGQTPADEATLLLSSSPMFANVENAHLSGDGQVSFDVLFLNKQGNVASLYGRLDYDYSPDHQVIKVIIVQIPPTPLGIIISSYGVPSHAATWEETRVVPSDWSAFIVWEMLGLEIRADYLDISQNVDEDLLFEYAYYFEPGLERYRVTFGQNRGDMLSPWHGYAGLPDYQYVPPSIFSEETTTTP